MTHLCLAERAQSCPASTGVYRLYRGGRIIHVGMAAGAATLRSELLAHAAGEYGAETQAADKVDWEVAPDAAFAYRRFLSLYAAATYLASGGTPETAGPSSSKRHSLAAVA